MVNLFFHNKRAILYSLDHRTQNTAGLLMPFINCAKILLVQGTNSVWMQPMFYLGSLPISLLSFNILFLIIMTISFILTLFLPRHASFSDLFLKTTVIDDVDIIE